MRRAEAIGALSLASDLASGHPLEHGLRACLVATRLADLAGADRDTRSLTYHGTLLALSGCTGDAGPFAARVGDEVAFARDFAPYTFGRPPEQVRAVIRSLGAGRRLPARVATVMRTLPSLPATMKASSAAHCEVARLLAAQLDAPLALPPLLEHVFERWDGKGFPGRLRGDAVPLPVRLETLGFDAALFHLRAGVEGAQTMLRRRAGHAFDPELVDLFCRHADDLLEPDDASVWQVALDAEPGEAAAFDPAGVDRALQALGDFADLKSFATVGHARGVAILAAEAAARCQLAADEQRLVRRAAHVQESGAWRSASAPGIGLEH